MGIYRNDCGENGSERKSGKVRLIVICTREVCVFGSLCVGGLCVWLVGQSEEK